MPIYVYRCESCAAQLERLQQMSAPPLVSCPSCGGPLRRVLAPGAAIVTRSGAGSRQRQRSGRSPGECSLEQPCCGREQRCDRPPCSER